MRCRAKVMHARELGSRPAPAAWRSPCAWEEWTVHIWKVGLWWPEYPVGGGGGECDGRERAAPLPLGGGWLQEQGTSHGPTWT